VCILSYNQAHYLIEAIESVLVQTLQPFEVIIVDDASSDHSPDLIASFAARYPDLIKPHYHTLNHGVSRARNTALNFVTGDFVTFLDGDDRFLPHKLEKEAEIFRTHLRTQLVFSNYFITDDHGQREYEWVKPGEHPPEGNIFCHVFSRDMPGRNWFRSEMVHYQLWQQVGFYDPALTLYEDLDMRIRLTKVAIATYCNATLSDYRQHEQGLSRRKPSEHLDALKYIYHKNRHLLDDLPAWERQAANARRRRLLAIQARRAAQWELDNGTRKAALNYGLRALRYGWFDRGSIRLMLKLLTP